MKEYIVQVYGKAIGKIEAASEEQAIATANLCYGNQVTTSAITVQGNSGKDCKGVYKKVKK